MGGGEGENLAVIRGVGEHLLVARHGGVEDHLALDDGGGAGGPTRENRSPSQHEVSGPRIGEEPREITWSGHTVGEE